MSKILEATADETGKVTAEGIEVFNALVQSLGKQNSAGLLFIDGEKVFYMPSSATDIKTTIEKLSAVIADLTASLTEVNTALTSIGAVAGPAWAPPPTIATSVAQIAAKIITLTTTKTELDTLKEALK